MTDVRLTSGSDYEWVVIGYGEPSACQEPCCVAHREYADAWHQLISLYRQIIRARTGQRIYGRPRA